jgi:hypothetical protein
VTTVYVTKYALTMGILKTELVSASNGYGYVKWPGGLNGEMQCAENEWFHNLEFARFRASKMRDLKIQSLKKSIAKMEKLTFDKVKELA